MNKIFDREICTVNIFAHGNGVARSHESTQSSLVYMLNLTNRVVHAHTIYSAYQGAKRRPSWPSGRKIAKQKYKSSNSTPGKIVADPNNLIIKKAMFQSHKHPFLIPEEGVFGTPKHYSFIIKLFGSAIIVSDVPALLAFSLVHVSPPMIHDLPFSQQNSKICNLTF